jgi:hypothetical protein
MNEGKSRLKSKTYYWAALLLAIGAAILALPEFQAFLAALDPAIYGWIMGVIAVVTAILREFTQDPLK